MFKLINFRNSLGGGLSRQSFKKKILILSIVLILLISIVGVSYAIWEISFQQTDENLLDIDCFDVAFEETMGSNIGLQNAFPLTDKEGATLKPYKFKISNKCDAFAYFNIQVEVKNTTTMDDDYLKVKLNKKGAKVLTDYTPSDKHLYDDTSNAYVIETGTLKKEETKEYELRLWIDEAVTTDSTNKNGSNIQGSRWEGKISITTGYKEDKFRNSGTMRTVGYYEDKGMYSKKANISKIIIEDELVPKTGTGVLGPFDESSTKDESVLSYLVPDPENDGMYIAYLQGEGGVKGGNEAIFHGFSKATAIEGLENYDTSNVTSMRHMFSDSGFTALDLSGLDTSNVNDMTNAFCLPNIKELDLSSLDTSNVTTMAAMFATFGGTKLDIRNLDTSHVKDMQSMFQRISNLEELDLSNFDTSNVENMSQMFQVTSNTSKLKKLDLSSFDTSRITTMAVMFSGLNELTYLNLGENFNTSSVKDMSGMFQGLQSLKVLNLGNHFNTANVENMSGMFYGLSSLEELNLGEQFNTHKVTDMGTMFAFMNKLKKLDLGNSFDTSLVTSMSGMFNGLEELTYLNLGHSFNTSNVKSMDLMFRNLKKLETLNLGNHFDTSAVTNMNSMFGSMEKLKTLDLGNLFNTSQVTNMGGMFSNLMSVTTLNLGNKFDTSNVDDMNLMFQGLNNLSSIDYGSLFVHKAGANIKNMFHNSPQLEKPKGETWDNIEWDAA